MKAMKEKRFIKKKKIKINFCLSFYSSKFLYEADIYSTESSPALILAIKLFGFSFSTVHPREAL